MTNTPFSKKCRILHDFYFEYRHDEDWAEFFDQYDLGIPLAAAFVMGGMSLEDRGRHWINETFDALVDALDKDLDMEYESLDDLMGTYAEG
jgi:hypothetical protein